MNDRGYNVKVFYLMKPENKSFVQILKNENIIKKFFIPSYKIYNIPAHFINIVNSEIKGSTEGYEMALSTGF